ncbi:hypothetical protein ACP4OV_012536 [Aristida adscensionis]
MGADVAWAGLQLALLSLALALWHLVLRPRAIASSMARQGVRGPPYRFLAGSMPEAKRLVAAGRRGVPPLHAASHDIIPVLHPQFHRWVAEYEEHSGRTFLYWIGPIPAIFTLDLELVKQVLTDRTGMFPKDFMIPVVKNLFGNGLIFINGDDWKRHRKVVLPAFNHDKLKSLSVVTAEVTGHMIQQWRNQIKQSDGQATEIDMTPAFCDLTEEILGRVAFGMSLNQANVKEVVSAMREMQKLGTAATLQAPILWYLPTRSNLRVRQLKRLVGANIMSIMQTRVAAKGSNGGDGYGDDLFGLLLDAWSSERPGSSETLSTQEVIDEFKTFFIAGQETTTTLLVWAMFLLSVHPHWQEKVREEILRECPDGELPNANVLGKLKLLYMVLLETLRLYPPIVYIQRRTGSNVVLAGNISVPKGTLISIPIGMLHRDKEIWGPDADDFNPARFENGVSRAAKDPKALLSFSLGPRACTGQNFGIMEAQVVMAMILRKFSFSLSPKYVQKPKFLLALTPKRGMPLIVRNIAG